MEITGYEIHMGRTRTEEKTNAFRVVETPQGPADYADGVLDARGQVMGTYMHGLFHNDEFRRSFLNNLRNFWGLAESTEDSAIDKDKEYDKLAELVRANLNVPEIYRIMGIQV